MSNAAHDTAKPEMIHPWEARGLGKAPFRWVGVSNRVGPIRIAQADGTTLEIGGPGQPMGTCAYCLQGIVECHEIRSADGQRFIVGCDCVRRVSEKGDRVLTQAEQASRKLKNAKAQKRRDAKADAVESELATLLADEAVRARLAALPSDHDWKAKQGGTLLADLEWLLKRAGAQGRAKALARIKATP